MAKDKSRKADATCSFLIDLNTADRPVDLQFRFRLEPKRNRRGKRKVLVTVTHDQPLRVVVAPGSVDVD